MWGKCKKGSPGLIGGGGGGWGWSGDVNQEFNLL